MYTFDHCRKIYTSHLLRTNGLCHSILPQVLQCPTNDEKVAELVGKRTGENHAWYIDLLGIVWKFRGILPIPWCQNLFPTSNWPSGYPPLSIPTLGDICNLPPKSHPFTSPIQIRPWHNGSMIGSYWICDFDWFWGTPNAMGRDFPSSSKSVSVAIT